MSTGDLLSIEPQELRFPFELRKKISCSLRLSNKTDNYVAFKVMTTNPTNYGVRLNPGIVLPRSTCDVIVTMQAQKEAPLDMRCKDKFLIRSVTANPGVTAKDLTREMFNKEPGRNVEKCKMRVVYVAPPRPPLRAPEGSSPPASISDGRNLNILGFTAVIIQWFRLQRHLLSRRAIQQMFREPIKQMRKSHIRSFVILVT